MVYNGVEIIIQNEKMKLEEIKKEQRPRERLIEKGAKVLTDIELLAIILSFGSKKENVLELSSRLINDYGLERLLNMNYDELKQIDGIKEAKATKLMACFEIARRSIKKSNNGIEFIHSIDVVDYIKRDYQFIQNEMYSIIYVDVKGKLLKKLFFESELSYKVSISIRSIVKEGIILNAYGIYMIHNHPSNDVRPSSSDISTTKLVFETLKSIDINLIDHIIIGNDNYFSFYENKLIIKK